MALNSNPVPREQIAASPAGRGRRSRPELTVNQAFVRSVLERGIMTTRDEAVLSTLDELGVLSVDQLARLYWGTPSTARHRLRKLYDMHMLDRSEYNPVKMKSLDLIPGIVYNLGKAGRMWLDLRTGDKESYAVQPLNSLYHDLAVAELIVILVEAVRLNSGWTMAWQGKSCRVHDEQDKKRTVILEPDGLIGLRHEDKGPEVFYYLERDLGTENHAAFRDKINRYSAYCNNGNWRARLPGGKFPSVLLVCSGAERAKNLAETIQAAHTQVIWGVCDFNTLMKLQRAELPWARVWTVIRPGAGIQQSSLLKP